MSMNMKLKKFVVMAGLILGTYHVAEYVGKTSYRDFAKPAGKGLVKAGKILGKVIY